MIIPWDHQHNLPPKGLSQIESSRLSPQALMETKERLLQGRIYPQAAEIAASDHCIHCKTLRDRMLWAGRMSLWAHLLVQAASHWANSILTTLQALSKTSRRRQLALKLSNKTTSHSKNPQPQQMESLAWLIRCIWIQSQQVGSISQPKELKDILLQGLRRALMMIW